MLAFVPAICSISRPAQQEHAGRLRAIVAAVGAVLCVATQVPVARALSYRAASTAATSSIDQMYHARKSMRDPVNVDTATLVVSRPTSSDVSPSSDAHTPSVSNPVVKVDVLARPELDPAAEVEMLTRMCFAVTCGAIIGVERRAASATAGVRTNALVSLGSSVFVLTALYGLNGPSMDSGVAKMCAAVSTGIGFLGAGAINRSGKGNRNLTTSASIWIAATLGVSSALGLYRLALKGALITVFILRWSTLSRYSRLVLHRRRRITLAFVRRELGWWMFARHRPQPGMDESQDDQSKA
jgi:putative Mg2+ transporter-C (MgtC) family protein